MGVSGEYVQPYPTDQAYHPVFGFVPGESSFSNLPVSKAFPECSKKRNSDLDKDLPFKKEPAEIPFYHKCQERSHNDYC